MQFLIVVLPHCKSEFRSLLRTVSLAQEKPNKWLRPGIYLERMIKYLAIYFPGIDIELNLGDLVVCFAVHLKVHLLLTIAVSICKLIGICCLCIWWSYLWVKYLLSGLIKNKEESSRFLRVLPDTCILSDFWQWVTSTEQGACTLTSFPQAKSVQPLSVHLKAPKAIVCVGRSTPKKTFVTTE